LGFSVLVQIARLCRLCCYFNSFDKCRTINKTFVFTQIKKNSNTTAPLGKEHWPARTLNMLHNL